MHFGGVLLQFLHASNKKRSRFIPCGKWIHANNLKTSKNQSTNPQTLNPLQKKCVQLRPAARTAVRDWNVICSRKHFFIVSMGMQMSLFRGSWPHARALQCPPSAQRRTHYFSWFFVWLPARSLHHSATFEPTTYIGANFADWTSCSWCFCHRSSILFSALFLCEQQWPLGMIQSKHVKNHKAPLSSCTCCTCLRCLQSCIALA